MECSLLSEKDIIIEKFLAIGADATIILIKRNNHEQVMRISRDSDNGIVNIFDSIFVIKRYASFICESNEIYTLSLEGSGVKLEIHLLPFEDAEPFPVIEILPGKSFFAVLSKLEDISMIPPPCVPGEVFLKINNRLISLKNRPMLHEIYEKADLSLE